MTYPQLAQLANVESRTSDTRPGAYPSKHLSGAPLLGRLLAFLTNIRLCWKYLPGTNALAYYEKLLLTVIKSCILWPLVFWHKILFSVSLLLVSCLLVFLSSDTHWLMQFFALMPFMTSMFGTRVIRNGVTTLSIMTFSLMILNMIGMLVTLGMNDT